MNPSAVNRLGTALLLLAGLSSLTHALPDDRDQPVRISADQAEQDEQRGITTYSGHVVISQGSIRMTADEVIIYSEQGEVSRMDARGTPAVLQQQPDANKGPVWARGKLVRYHLTDEHLELIGDASLEQENSTVRGERIDYYIQKRLVKAASQSKGSDAQRVEVVLPPKPKPATQDTPPNGPPASP
ncbi:MAG TPA: lipopolysaccharide transport periplasmic protein LptA [Pseudomonadales bacterium]|jgi:lipopolysaccharide export system protein LptA